MTRKVMMLFFLAFAIVAQGQELFNKINEPLALTEEGFDYFINPEYAPDGKKIAYTGANYKGIWIHDLKVNTITKISSDVSAGYGYLWSADSKSLVSRIAKFDEGLRFNAIKLIDVESKSQNLLTEFKAGRMGLPRWTADNSRVYFSDGKEVSFLASGKAVDKTAVKPDYYQRSGQIVIRNTQNSRETLLDRIRKFDFISLILSPDGNRFAFEAMDGNIYAVDADGDNLQNFGPGDCPAWSPDSRFITYSITQDDGHQYTASDIFIISLLSGTTQKVTNTSDMLEMNPCWSPDGKSIVYNELTSGVIYRVELQKN